MNIFKKLWDVIKDVHKVVHNTREDFEDFFADKVLKKLDEMKSVDDLERAGVIALIAYLNANRPATKIAEKMAPQYTGQVGQVETQALGQISAHDQEIAEKFLKCMHWSNDKLQEQLRKGEKI